MNENTVHYLFDPNSPGWIRRRVAKGEYVSSADVARVVRLHPDCITDPEILEHATRLLEGRVKKPKGRRRHSPGRTARIWLAGELAREQMKLWREGIGEDCPRKGRSELPIAEVAYTKFGLPLGLSGKSLANAVSSLKSDPLFGE